MTSINAIINRQFLRWELERKEAQERQHERPQPAPIVTISRQTGSRGSYFGSRLAQRLNYQRLHRQVIDEICESSGYRKRIIESLDEKFRSEIENIADSIFTGQSVDYSDYIRHLGHVILSMSRLGGVIVMGRGANFILGPKNGFHIRVVCPREKRIENLIKYTYNTNNEASTEIDSSDSDRKHFIKNLYGSDIDDSCSYDLVMNSALIDVEEMVEIAQAAIQAKVNKLAWLDHDLV